MAAYRAGDSKYSYKSLPPDRDRPSRHRQSLGSTGTEGDRQGRRVDDRARQNQGTKYSDSSREFRNAELKDRSSYGNVLFPAAVQPEHKAFRPTEEVYHLQADGISGIKDEDSFLYGSELTHSSFSKDYMHGNTAAREEDPRVIEVENTSSLPDSQVYDSTIEDILKSIGFNVDFANIKDEPTKTDPIIVKTETPAFTTNAFSVDSLKTNPLSSGGRNSSSKKIDTILSSHESYEERARRYREEQTRMYAEASTAGSDLSINCSTPPSRSLPSPPSAGQSSLEFLQKSYDYDKIVKEISQGLRDKQNPRLTVENSLFWTTPPVDSDPPLPKASHRTLYEDFSDSDDNLSDTGKIEPGMEERGTCGMKVFENRHVPELNKEKRTLSVEPDGIVERETYHRLDKEKPAKRRDVQNDSEVSNARARRVKVMSNTNTQDIGSHDGSVGKKTGVATHHVASRWDSPQRDGSKTDGTETESKSQASFDPKLSKRRKAKIFSLNNELEKLKQEQKELMRRKQRSKYGHNDPELLENGRLQSRISATIEKMTKCSDEEFAKLANEYDRDQAGIAQEKQAAVLNNTAPNDDKVGAERSDKPKLPKMVVKYDYFDDGCHWCRSCNQIFDTVQELCEHLHSSLHIQKMDLNHRPWASKNSDVKPDIKQGGVPMPIKGVEFLMPTQAFYCSLCKSFFADTQLIEEHLKSHQHNETYQRYVENENTYEHHYNLDKTAALSLIGRKTLNPGTKRSAVVKPTDQNAKRLKTTSETPQKSTPQKSASDNNANGREPKPTVPQSSISSVAEIESTVAAPVETNSRKANSTSAETPTARVQENVANLKLKPTFIGKLPCLRIKGNKTNAAFGPKAISSKVLRSLYNADGTSICMSKISVKSGADVENLKGMQGSSDASLIQSDLQRSSNQAKDSNERKTEFTSSDQTVTTSTDSCDKSRRSESEEPVGCSSVNTVEMSDCAEAEMVEDTMCLGDFEVFDECDAN